MEDIENPIINCSICLKDNIDESELCKTNCNHCFCKGCLDDWFDRGEISCPLCRGEIKYFNHDNQNNRIIKLEKKRQNNQNNLNQTNIQRYLNSRDNLNNVETMIQRIIIENRKLKCYFYLSLITGLNYMTNYYLSSSINKELNDELYICKHNNTILYENLDTCYNIVNYLDDTTSVTIGNGVSYIKCGIPTVFYNQCFDL